MTTSLPRAEIRIGDGSAFPAGYQQLTGLSSAKALTVPDGAFSMLLCPESQGVRYRDDGVAPTASTGMPIAAGEKFPFTGDLTKFLFIEQSASATLNISYYK